MLNINLDKNEQIKQRFDTKKTSFLLNQEYDLTQDIFDFSQVKHKDDEQDILNAKHKKSKSIHKEAIKKLKMCPTVDKKCISEHKHKNTKECEQHYKEEVKKICPSNCNCNFRCECGWEPNQNLPEKDKKKQYDKHFEKVIDLHIIATEMNKPRYPELEVIIKLNSLY